MEQQNTQQKQKTVKIKLEMISDLKSKMQELPKIEPTLPENLSKQEAVKLLSPEIEKLIAKNYSFEQIAEFFKTNDFPIDAPTLKTYISRLKPKKAVKNKAEKQSSDKVPTVSETKSAPTGDFSETVNTNTSAS